MASTLWDNIQPSRPIDNIDFSLIQHFTVRRAQTESLSGAAQPEVLAEGECASRNRAAQAASPDNPT
jgi:hypothetical protein